MAQSAARPGPGGRDAAPGPDPRRWKALAVCLVAGFMTLLDVSIVNVALPSIREGLNTPSPTSNGCSPATPSPSASS